MLSSVSRAAVRTVSHASGSKALGHKVPPIRLYTAYAPVSVTRPPLHALRQRRRSCAGSTEQAVRRLSSARVLLKAGADAQKRDTAGQTAESAARRPPTPAPASSIDPSDRPTIPPTPLPELSPSPLLAEHPTPPPPASSTIRTAIADFLAAEEIGDVKPPPADLTRIKRLWWQAKQLFAFYWNGLKSVYANWRRACQLRMGVEDHGWKLTRREEVFLRRVDSDVVKLIPFVLILIILEEALPLLVLYAPYLLPSTCILPSQLLRIKEKEEAVRRQGLVRLATASEGARLAGPAQLDAETLRGACMALDLGKVATAGMLRRRLARRFQWLQRDDELLRGEGNGRELSVEEKRLLLADRGLSSLFAPADTLQERIDSWLSATTESARYEQTALELMRDEAVRVRAEAPAAPAQEKEESSKEGTNDS